MLTCRMQSRSYVYYNAEHRNIQYPYCRGSGGIAFSGSIIMPGEL